MGQPHRLAIPAHAVIHVTGLEYDSQTGLRNPFMSQIRGPVGNIETAHGQTVRYMNPNLPAHTFSIPELGLQVPHHLSAGTSCGLGVGPLV